MATPLLSNDTRRKLRDDRDTLQCLAQMLGRSLPEATFAVPSLIDNTFNNLDVSVSHFVHRLENIQI